MTIEITIGELIERLEKHDGDLHAVIAEEEQCACGNRDRGDGIEVRGQFICGECR